MNDNPPQASTDTEASTPVRAPLEVRIVVVFVFAFVFVLVVTIAAIIGVRTVRFVVQESGFATRFRGRSWDAGVDAEVSMDDAEQRMSSSSVPWITPSTACTGTSMGIPVIATAR